MKANRLFLALIAAAMLGINPSCKKKTEYPQNPKDKEVYVDSYGNRSVWNSALGYWMIYSAINNHPGQTYYYYPSSGTYRNSNFQTIEKPTHLPAVRTSSPTRSSMNSRGVGNSSSGKSSFGSSGRGSSSGS